MRKKEIFPVTGLGCAACAARVGKVLNAQDGVTEANVNYASATALVEYDTDRCSPESLRKAVEEAGYGLITDVENEEEAAEAERLKQYRALRRQTAGAVIGAVPVFVLSMFFMDLVFHQCLETAAARCCQYGHSGGRQYGSGLAVQRLQSVLPGLLAFPRHRAASVF